MKGLVSSMPRRPAAILSRIAALAKPSTRALQRAYRASPRDVVGALRKRVVREHAAALTPEPSPPTEAFLRSAEYSELISRHLPVDGSYDSHEAQNETQNYRFRHHTLANRLGVCRWRGMQKHLDTCCRCSPLPAARSSILGVGRAARAGIRSG
jgi:hypothetical protein